MARPGYYNRKHFPARRRARPVQPLSGTSYTRGWSVVGGLGHNDAPQAVACPVCFEGQDVPRCHLYLKRSARCPDCGHTWQLSRPRGTVAWSGEGHVKVSPIDESVIA